MYPEVTQLLSELIQNADDAKASVVKFVISKKQHGTSSLLGQKMSEWQGGALYCYNDATFTARDFKNLSQIGQASKLEKLVTTGRFGLGFNSVFHWTDVPSVVSSDSLVMFDPHAKVRREILKSDFVVHYIALISRFVFSMFQEQRTCREALKFALQIQTLHLNFLIKWIHIVSLEMI